MKKYLFPIILGLQLTINASASLLYFETSGDDLVITAKESDDSAQYWSLTLTQAAAGVPSGTMGSISQFYDLTGDSGSNASFNIAGGNGLLGTYIDSSGGVPSGGTWLSSHPNASLAAPSGVNGSSSYTFSISTQFADATASGAMATFTSSITLNAPTSEGTRFNVVNTLTTPSDWVSSDAFGAGARESRSGLASYTQLMQDATLDSLNGWNETPKDANQYGQKTAVGTSTNYAEGRTFLLSQTVDLDPVDISTHPTVHAGVSNTTEEALLVQMLSGLFRGSAPADGTYSSTGFLDINIAAISSVPEPSTYALILSSILLVSGVFRRLKTIRR